ncbi:MAG: hypothetical protein DCF30_15085 [Hyphomicrobiales bacterium]|nr:MAG: hypothetical protein DCF30_15085 [Hyphomicrobiales bacterium]
MHLTYRPCGWRFQIRIPRDLEALIGTSPIRLNIGPLAKRRAARVARLLAGHAEALFVACHTGARMTKDELIAELQRMLISALDAVDHVALQADRRQARELNALTLATASERLTGQMEVDARLQAIGTGISALHGRISALPKDQRGTIGEQLAELSALVKTSLDGGPERPLLLDELDRWIELRAGHAADKKIKTDRARILDFVAFAGNRPVNRYRHSDFQAFANLLARVPAGYTKDARLRHMTRQEVADYNDSLAPARRLPTLAATAIEANYISPLAVFFRAMAADHDFRSPMADVGVTIPSTAKASVQRSPFSVSDLNVWFAAAASERRPDLKWLPLLATLTGARVGELIHLQGKDVYQLDTGLWVASLLTDITAADGSTSRRQIKNKPSRRLFALHGVLEQTDFFAYCASRKPEDWLFPHAFRHGKSLVADPADAASKRMNRQLRTVGIHRPLEATFHSTRHTAKDLMRVAKVDPRTADRQTGHAPKTVADSYGSKTLLPEEVEVLAALALPEGLDLAPYFVKRDRSGSDGKS